MDKRFDVNLFDNKHNANYSLALDINFTENFRFYPHLSFSLSLNATQNEH